MSKEKRKVGTDGELYSLDFPVEIPTIQKNPVHLVRMNLEASMISSLKKIIRSHGDEQEHASNVKADMTDWFMHHQYQEFKQLSIRVEGELKKVTGGSGDKATQKDLPYLTTECWGAIYRKGDQTVPHTHWGSLWSWCYYLKVPEDAPPFRFANVISKTSMVDNNLESKFLDEAAKNNIIGIKGHRSVGGVRISLYNAVTKEMVDYLSNFLDDFLRKNEK